MTIALLLAAAISAQQPDLRDPESVAALLASLRKAEPAVCELAGRSLSNFGGYWDGELVVPRPMPMPMPMPMPWAGRGISVRSPAIGGRSGRDLDPRVLQAFRGALTDASRCVRHIAARIIAHSEPAWAAAEFSGLVKNADAGLRATGLLGLGELEDPQTIGTMTTALGDRDATVRGMAAWALGEIESSSAVAFLTPLLRDPDESVRAITAWALGEIESYSALPALEAVRSDNSPAVRRAVLWAIRNIDDRR